MKEQGQVLCAGRPPRRAETAVTRPWEPARPRAHRLTGLGAGWEGRDVLLTFSRGEGLALPCSLVPSAAAPRRGVTRLCGLGRCVGLPLEKPRSRQNSTARGGVGPTSSVPRCPVTRASSQAGPRPSLLQGPQGPFPPQGGSCALGSHGRPRGLRPVAVICAHGLGSLLSETPHGAEGAVRGSRLPHTGGLFYDAVLETIGLGRNNTDAFASQEAREFPLLSSVTA